MGHYLSCRFSNIEMSYREGTKRAFKIEMTDSQTIIGLFLEGWGLGLWLRTNCYLVLVCFYSIHDELVCFDLI